MPLTSFASILLQDIPAEVLYPVSACKGNDKVYDADVISWLGKMRIEALRACVSE